MQNCVINRTVRSNYAQFGSRNIEINFQEHFLIDKNNLKRIKKHGSLLCSSCLNIDSKKRRKYVFHSFRMGFQEVGKLNLRTV